MTLGGRESVGGTIDEGCLREAHWKRGVSGRHIGRGVSPGGKSNDVMVRSGMGAKKDILLDECLLETPQWRPGARFLFLM